MVTIVNEPYLIGSLDGELYFESHAPLEDDLLTPDERLSRLLDQYGNDSAVGLRQADRDHVRAVASVAHGVPVRIAEHDVDEVLARVRLVHNTVETDPDAPTLTEVREMIDEAVREAEAEEGAL